MYSYFHNKSYFSANIFNSLGIVGFHNTNKDFFIFPDFIYEQAVMALYKIEKKVEKFFMELTPCFHT